MDFLVVIKPVPLFFKDSYVHYPISKLIRRNLIAGQKSIAGILFGLRTL